MSVETFFGTLGAFCKALDRAIAEVETEKAKKLRSAEKSKAEKKVAEVVSSGAGAIGGGGGGAST